LALEWRCKLEVSGTSNDICSLIPKKKWRKNPGASLPTVVAPIWAEFRSLFVLIKFTLTTAKAATTATPTATATATTAAILAQLQQRRQVTTLYKTR